MTKTYAQVQKQIATLQREADQLKRKEVDSVVSRIKEAIEVYGLTAADLGLSGTVTRKYTLKAGKTSAKSRKAKAAGSFKFRDEAGNVWGGRGPRPHWLRAALAAGKQLSDFAV